MTAAYPEAISIEFYNGAAWIDISSYVVGDMRASYGLGGWKPENRVAAIGSLNLTLNNKAKLFSPMGGDALKSLNTLTGWTQGARIRVRVTFEAKIYVVWTGRILSIDSDDKNWGEERTRVVAVDWMNVPANFPMKKATIATSKRQDEAIDLILARLNVQPEAEDLDAGTQTFATVFDGVRNRTMAIAELNRLALSEIGYIYVKGDGTLRAENADARIGTRALDLVPQPISLAGRLALESGDLLLTEASDAIVLDLAVTPAIDASAESFNILLDPAAILNTVTVRAYPVATDTSLKVLYSLGVPMPIAGRKTIAFSAHFTDPAGGAQIGGTNMQTPAATTDYLCNSAADGSGSDYTADLAVTATYWGDTVEYSIILNRDANGYITKLQARGYGIYYGNSIESVVEDADSQATYGYGQAQIDQRYQRSPAIAVLAAQALIEEYKTPKSRITRMRYLANLNAGHMLAFLSLSAGALIALTEDRSAITRHYYITDVAFTIRQGGIIEVTYGLKQNETYLSGGLAAFSLECVGASADGLDYGYIPALDNLRDFSVSFWIYCTAEAVPFHVNYIVVHAANNIARWRIYEDSTKRIYVDIDFSGASGTWVSDPNTISFNAWHHVVVSRRTGLDASAVRIYIDGVSSAITLGATPSGTQNDDTGAHLIIGNYDDGVSEWEQGFRGKIFDVRIYNRTLSLAEAQAIYNSGTPDLDAVPDGMIFQGPAVYSDLGDATSLAGHVLLTTERTIENIHRYTGTPHGAAVIRATP